MSQKKYTFNYRGIELNLDADKISQFKNVKGYLIETVDIDQYLLNEADKTNIDFPNIDPLTIMKQFNQKQIEKIVNDYLDIEVKAWH